MTNTIFQITEKVLTDSEKYSSNDGKLLRNLALENAEKMDKELLSVLIKNEETKKAYFTEVDGIQVFDKVKFSWIIQNKEFLPDSYTRYKNKIGLTNSRGEFISSSNDVELVFPYKDCILEGGQTKEDQKNSEIFYNETLAPDQVSNLLAPKAFCNAKKYDKDGVHEVSEISDSDNLIIKGNNLLALSSLLEKYRGKVKCIYIDPPYNTGSDSFKYNDSFNHSTWLTFMKNRLELAKKLLRDDGCIFIQCDDNEQAYLKVLMDNILNKENYITTISCKVKSPGGLTANDEMFFNCSEYITVFAKEKTSHEFNSIKTPIEIVTCDSKTAKANKLIFTKLDVGNKKFIKEIDGISYYKIDDKDYEVASINIKNKEDSFFYDKRNELFRTTALSGGIGKKLKKSLKSLGLEKGLVVYEYIPTKGKDRGKKSTYLLLNEQKVSYLRNYIDVDDKNKRIIKLEPISNLFTDDLWQGISSEGVVTLNNGKKPEELLRRILEVATSESDIVLDFHLGSGTTAAVAHKMGRRYIGIEQLDYGENDSVVRLQNVINGDQTGISKSQNWQGGGSFVYCELAKLNQNFVDKIQSCKTDGEIKSVTEEILKSDFVSSKVKPSDINTTAKEYSELTFEEKQQLAMALLDKNQLYINYSERKDPDMKLSENDIKFTESFYNNSH